MADQQHSIRLAKGPGGVKRTAYLPHGTPLGYGTNPALAPGGRGYLNKTHDPNGDIRLDHRAYQPGLNVLTTPDALLTPYDPQGLNPYAYARNNPIGLSDPSGLLAADGTSRQDYCSDCADSQVGTYDESTMGSGWEDGEWDALVQSLGARQPDAIDRAVFGALDFAGGFGSSARGTVTGAWSLGSDIVSSPFSDDARDRMGARGSALADMARHPIRTAEGAWSSCMSAKARCAGGATFGVAAGLATGGASRLALAGRVGAAANGVSKFGSLLHSSAGIAPFSTQRAITAGSAGRFKPTTSSRGASPTSWAAVLMIGRRSWSHAPSTRSSRMRGGRQFPTGRMAREWLRERRWRERRATSTGTTRRSFKHWDSDD